MAEEKETSQEEKPQKDNPPKEEEFEPPIRQPLEPFVPSGKTPEGKRFWYELRKINQRLEKLEDALEGEREYYDEFGENDFDEEKKRNLRFSEEVDEKFSSFLEELDRRERQKEFREFLRDNPSFSKYEKQLEKFIHHSAYQNVPIEFIAKALAFEEAEKIGAQKLKEAEEEAKKTKIGGSPFKPSEREFPDYWEMSKGEFEREVEKVRQKGRD